MKKNRGFLLAVSGLFSLAISSAVFANQAHRTPGWFADFGLEGYRYNYEETVKDQFLMSDKGPMYGIYYGFGYQPECMDLRFAVEGRNAWSRSIHYTSARTGSYDNANYKVLELRLLAFYPWHLDGGWTLEGYSGIAGRSLINDDYGTRTNTGAIGYYRSSNYVYLPVGLRVIKEIDDMQLVTHLEYDWFMRGRQYSGVDGGVTNNQNEGYGFRMGLDLYIPACNQSFDYMVGAFLRYWDIEDSEEVQGIFRRGWYEPKNTTTEVGIRVGLVF